MPDQLVDLIASFHTGMQARVRVGDRPTDLISVNNGLRQGCSISPVLFSLVFERWNAEMARILPGGGLTFNHSREVPHNVITLVKNVVDLRKVLRKLHAHLGSAIRSFQIT